MDDGGDAHDAGGPVGELPFVGCGLRLDHEHPDPEAETSTDFCARSCPRATRRGSCATRRGLRAFQWRDAYGKRLERTKRAATFEVYEAICSWQKELEHDINHYPIRDDY